MGDEVNGPDHYDGDLCLRFIEWYVGGLELSGFAEYDETAYAGFILGNMVKYVYRAGRKEGQSAVKDLQKAEFYHNKYELLRVQRDGSAAIPFSSRLSYIREEIIRFKKENSK